MHISTAVQEAMSTLPPTAKHGECVHISSPIETVLQNYDFRAAANHPDPKERAAARSRLEERGIPGAKILERLTRERGIHIARMRGTIVLN